MSKESKGADILIVDDEPKMRHILRIILEEAGYSVKEAANGALKGVLPKQQLMWKAYSDMLHNLNDYPEDGIAMIRDDFAKEYENISYALKLNSKQNRSTF